MATINNTSKLIPYNAQSFPNLGSPERFITNELVKIQKSIASIIAVMQLMEQRMNTDGLA